MAEPIDLAERRRAKGWHVLLPLPPSVNAMYRNAKGRGRVKTARYEAWNE